MAIIQCYYCGDSCGEEVCYSCEELAMDMGIDIQEIMSA